MLHGEWLHTKTTSCVNIMVLVSSTSNPKKISVPVFWEGMQTVSYAVLLGDKESSNSGNAGVGATLAQGMHVKTHTGILWPRRAGTFALSTSDHP